MTDKTQGLFITFEGVDGTGKTTQAARLAQYLQTLGRAVTLTREPGGTPLGFTIRGLLLHGVPDTDDTNTTDATDGGISPRAEALLYAADRAQHVDAVIRPALESGGIVICDRYIDSSLAYQADGRGLTSDEIKTLSMWATGSLMPRRTYLLDMPADTARARLTHRPDRMESAGDGFSDRVRNGFRALAQDDPARFLTIDASQSIDDVWARIRQDADTLLTTPPQAAHGKPETNAPVILPLRH